MWEFSSKQRIWSGEIQGQQGSRAEALSFLDSDKVVSSNALINDHFGAPGRSSSLTIWTTATTQGSHRFEKIGGSKALAAVAMPNGWRIAARDYGIELLQSKNASIARSSVKLSHNITTLSFSPDGSKLVGTSDKCCSVWDVENVKELLNIRLETTLDISDATFTSDGREILLVNTNDDIMRYFDVASGEEIRIAKWLRGFRQISVSGDHRLMASCGHPDPGAYVWEVNSGQIVARYGVNNHYSDVAISSDGAYVAAMCAGANGFDGVHRWKIELDSTNSQIGQVDARFFQCSGSRQTRKVHGLVERGGDAKSYFIGCRGCDLDVAFGWRPVRRRGGNSTRAKDGSRL
jgi:WD40 repeat protein